MSLPRTMLVGYRHRIFSRQEHMLTMTIESTRLLRPIYNNVFDEKERRAEKALEDIVDSMGIFGKKR